MAKTSSRIKGKHHKKIVSVRSYKRANGTIVKAHRRSTPRRYYLKLPNIYIIVTNN